MSTIDSQRTEFSALASLVNEHQRITHCVVVDDDYPFVRHRYETALHAFIEAMKANNRFQLANPYGLRVLGHNELV